MTWDQIETLALRDPILQAAVTRVRQGVITRQDALIAVVVALSERMTVLQGARLDALMFGNGFVHVTHLAGEFQYRRLEPAAVEIHDVGAKC